MASDVRAELAALTTEVRALRHHVTEMRNDLDAYGRGLHLLLGEIAKQTELLEKALAVNDAPEASPVAEALERLAHTLDENTNQIVQMETSLAALPERTFEAVSRGLARVLDPAH